MNAAAANPVMAGGTAPVDLAPLVAVAAIALAVAAIPLAWLAWRQRGANPASRLRALALLTLVLSVDLVMLGAFTRLSDSGLGCPDWPGCYGHASPIGASEHIATAQAAVPTGPVTHGKAWIEMTHRYAAAAIGVLTIALAWTAWRAGRRDRLDIAPAWAFATVAWIVAQGAFGAFTVTMRLYPGIVTLHLLGGMGLLALLAAQVEVYDPDRPVKRFGVSPLLRAGIVATAVLVVVQLALGGWVSSNYAVLACQDFPTCQSSWWPDANFADAFVVRRALGTTGDGDALPFQALTAIHLAHRVGALVVVAASLALAARLATRGPEARRFALGLLAVCAWQVASGLGNVLLGWPLVAAVAHTAGGAALVVLMTTLLFRTAPSPRHRTAGAPSTPRRRASAAGVAS